MIGQTLGHYKILDKLGAGGMGEVYLAEDTDLGRKVAIKMLPAELSSDPNRLGRLKREAQVLAALDHPNIVTIHAVDKIDGVPVLAMELVEGKTLSDLIPEDGVSLRRFFELAIPLTKALGAAHEKGVVHRDLKPRNIMVSDEDVLKVLDFGLAKMQSTGEKSVDSIATTEALTVEGHVLGTMPYMAPEQVQGHEVDQRSDIFSLGIILYELATGHRPFRGANSADLVSSILRDEPDPIDELKREMPHHLARIIRQCLEKDPDKRLESAKDVRIQLQDLEREITTQKREIAPQPPAPPPEPIRWPVWLMAAVAAIAIVVAAVAWISRGGTEIEPMSAEAQELFDQAELFEQRGDTRENLEEAEDRYRRALRLEPEDPKIQARLAALLARAQRQYPVKGRDEEITRLAEIALEKEADSSRAFVALGTLELLEGDAAAAEELARQALASDLKDHRGHTLLGEALVAQERVDEGLISLRRGVELAATDLGARTTLARVLSDLGRYSEAASEYERILQYDPDQSTALNNLASIYMRTGRQLDAIPLLQRALRLGNDEAAASNLGTIYYSLGQLDKAIEMYEMAYRFDPDKPYAPYNIADTYEALGNPAAARQWYEKAMVNFDRVLAAGGPRSLMLALRALCAARLGRYEEALSGVEEALALEPSNAKRVFNAAQVAALAEDDALLVDYIQQALVLGHPRQDFFDDAAFAAYQDNPRFLQALLESEGDS